MTSWLSWPSDIQAALCPIETPKQIEARRATKPGDRLSKSMHGSFERKNTAKLFRVFPGPRSPKAHVTPPAGGFLFSRGCTY